MPETRNAATSEAIAAVASSVTDLSVRIQIMKEKAQTQVSKIDQIAQTQEAKFEQMMSMMEKMNGLILDLHHRHPENEVIDSQTPSSKFSQVQSSAVGFDVMVESVESAEVTHVFEDVESGTTAENIVVLEVDVVAESGKEDFGLEVDLHSDSTKSAVIGCADREVTSDKFSVDDSAFLWNKDDLGKCEEHDDLNEEIQFEASLDDLISNFSFRVSGVCRNASMNRPTHFTMHMDLSSRLNNILPPAKPPDDDVLHDVVTWDIRLDRSLQQFGFKRCTQEQAVYTKKGKEDDIIIGVYVDDLIVTGESLLMVEKFKEQLTKEFEMNDLGKLSYYLGIEVKQSAERITLKQPSYEWRWQLMSLRVNREVSDGNHPPHSDFNVAVGMARDGAAVTHHGVELELVVSSENNSCGAFSAGNGDHIETASGYGKIFSAICPTSITRARSMPPFPQFSMGIFVCIEVVQFFRLRSYVATPEPPTEAHDSVTFAKHKLCYSYELFYAILIHTLGMNEKLYEALLSSPRPTLTPLTYNAWIGACAGNDDLEKSLNLMSKMRRDGFQPDFVNYSLIIQSFTRANTVDSVVLQKLYSEIKSDLVECNVHENRPHLEPGVAGLITKHGFLVKRYVVNLIIKTLLQNGEMSKATELFWQAGRNEHTVIFMEYEFEKKNSGQILVFDPGGGTFNVSVHKEFANWYVVEGTSLINPAITDLLVNLIAVAVAVGVSKTIYKVLLQWNKLNVRVFFNFWVLTKFMAYDHMYLGSSPTPVHGNIGASRTLVSWEMRFGIILGAASGIAFPHMRGSGVYYGHTKAANKSYEFRGHDFSLFQLAFSSYARHLITLAPAATSHWICPLTRLHVATGDNASAQQFVYNWLRMLDAHISAYGWTANREKFQEQFIMFSSPRPPEVADLEDKVNFMGRGMLRTQYYLNKGV